MTLFQDTGDDPRAASSVVADVLTWYGAVGDCVLGNPPGFALHKASIAVSLARNGGVAEEEIPALYFAAVLHAAGAIGNRAFRKGERLPERIARMESWDVPAQGAQLCAQIAALPQETPDLVRWQSEAWDGTGYPDQLRWFGIPRNAQLLGLADRFAHASDPEEALGAIGMESGRSFGPDHVRAFTMWFHTFGGQADPIQAPLHGLREVALDPAALLDLFADRIDAHNGADGRWRRVDAIARATASALTLDQAQRRTLALACRIFGAGEIPLDHLEDEAFDPLARMGIDERARDAAIAAALAHPLAALSDAAAVVAARGQWYDGSGKPAARDRGASALPASILGAAIAYERLDRSERLDTAAGTQFDPAVVRAMMLTKSRA